MEKTVSTPKVRWCLSHAFKPHFFRFKSFLEIKMSILKRKKMFARVKWSKYAIINGNHAKKYHYFRLIIIKNVIHFPIRISILRRIRISKNNIYWCNISPKTSFHKAAHCAVEHTEKKKKIPVILETFLAFFFSYYILECHELNME